MKSQIKTVAIVVAAAAYPFLGPYLIRNGWGGLVLVLFAALTLWRGLKAAHADFRLGCILGAALLLVGAYFSEAYTVRLIPAFVYLSLAFLFGHTLWHPPSLCERLVRLQYPEFKPGMAEYLRQVTWVWAGFFAANVIICTLLPLLAQPWVDALHRSGGLWVDGLLGYWGIFLPAKAVSRPRNPTADGDHENHAAARAWGF